MTFEKLGNLCKITSGGTPSRNKPEYFANGDIPWIKTGDLGKKFVTEPLERISQTGLDNSSAKIFPANTVLVAMYGATIGSCSILSFEASTNQACAAFLPSQKLHHEYLYYFLKSIKRTLISMGKGGGQPNISAGLLKDVEIPLLPLNDQIRIAHLLGKVEGLIDQRKQHLQQLDDLLKSVFLEMFGDPVRNDMGWVIHPCEKVVLDISSGTSYGGEDRAFVSSDEVGVLKISAVTKGAFDPTQFKVVNPSQISKVLRFVKRGDFLFSRANTVELVAACCIAPEDYNQLFLPDKLWALTLNQELINAQFFNYLLKNERYRNVVRNLASGGHDSMLNISMKKFMTLDVPCPPVDIQNHFAAIVEKVESINSRYQQSLTDLESLYGALSRQAFKGELDLSRVPVMDIAAPPKVVDTDGSDTLLPDMQTLATRMVMLDEPAMASPEGRANLLRQWFSAWFNSVKPGQPIDVEAFWESARMQALDYQPEEPIEFGADDYDQLKKWIFDCLEAGTLKQVWDEENKRIQLKAVQA